VSANLRSASKPIVAVAALAVLLVGCRGQHVSTVIGEVPVPLDPGLVYRDSALQVDIAGNGRGLVKLGRGWHQQRYRSAVQRWRLDSWADGSPTLYFLSPLEGSWDLILRCAPFSHPENREQILTPVLNGNDLPGHRLESGFHDLRISLPREHLRSAINELVLRFAWTVVPREIGKGDEHRPTAVKVSSIKMAPRGRDPRILQKRASVLEESTATIRLRAGSPVALPLVARNDRELVVTDIEGAEPDEQLVLEFLGHRGTRRSLWRGHPEQLRGQRVDLTTAPATPVYLVLSSRNRRHGALGLQIQVKEADRQDTAFSDESAELPNIFIYTIDTLRADALGTYGYHRPTSPRIDAFAAEAMVFERAWSPSPYTPPATMSLLTGLFPYRHRFVHARRRPSGTLAPLLSELLQDNGYETVAISQSYNIGPLYTFERGFESFYSNDAVARAGSESADVAWFLWNHVVFRSSESRPLFGYIHVVDTHQPYKPQGGDRTFAMQHGGWFRDWKYQPEYFWDHGLADNTEEVAHMRGLYDGEVLRADRQFGRFLDLLRYLGLYESSLIILTADHGEEFAEHRGFGHIRSLYAELVHVPLLAKLPAGREAGRSIRKRVSLVDVVPTVLELAGGIPQDLDLDGTSFARPDEIDDSRYVLAEINPWPGEAPSDDWRHRSIDLRAAVSGDLKCIENRLDWDRFGRPAERFQQK